MTATNINVEEFVEMLQGLQQEGVKMINLDMIQDEHYSNMNRLIIHPIYPTNPPHSQKGIEIKNRDVDTNNNDIFNLFDNIV